VAGVPARNQHDGRFAGRATIVLAALPGLAACAVGPDFKPPASPPGADYTPTPLPVKTESAPVQGGEAQSFAIGRDIQFDWWTLFQSRALDTLVQQAFEANPTIDSAQAALRQAQENVYAQQGYFFPTVTAGYTFERQQVAGNLSSNAPGLQANGTFVGSTSATPVTYNFHTARRLRAGRVRRQPKAGRIAPGAGRQPALHTGGGVYHSRFQHRGGGFTGSLHPRADRGDP
jgi:outer membrane protein TolC